MPNRNSLNNLDFERVVQKQFVFSGTYIPTTGMKYCIVEQWGGGGAGGGAAATGANEYAAGGGGGGGNYSRSVFSASSIGASRSITIGAGGTNGGAGNTNGGNGGQTSLASLQTANGGLGGTGGGNNPGTGASNGGGTGTITGGTVNFGGSPGGTSIVLALSVLAYSGFGGAAPGSGTVAGSYAVGVGANTTPGANRGNNTAGGGPGGLSAQTGSATTGGNGGSGYVLITEFVSP